MHFSSHYFILQINSKKNAIYFNFTFWNKRDVYIFPDM